jgi:hypothetical protein
MALGVSAATAGTHQASLDGSQEVPPVQTDATGVAKLDLNTQTGELHIVLTLNGVSGQTNAHIHGPAPPGQNAGVMLGLPLGDIDQVFIVDAATIDAIQNGLAYFNIHTQQNPGGEIRGQISNQPTPVEPESWSGIKDHYR